MGYIQRKKKKVTCNLKKVKQGLPVLVAAAVFCRHSMVYKDNKWYWYA